MEGEWGLIPQFWWTELPVCRGEGGGSFLNIPGLGETRVGQQVGPPARGSGHSLAFAAVPSPQTRQGRWAGPPHPAPGTATHQLFPHSIMVPG